MSASGPDGISYTFIKMVKGTRWREELCIELARKLQRATHQGNDKRIRWLMILSRESMLPHQSYQLIRKLGGGVITPRTGKSRLGNEGRKRCDQEISVKFL